MTNILQLLDRIGESVDERDTARALDAMRRPLFESRMLLEILDSFDVDSRDAETLIADSTKNLRRLISSTRSIDKIELKGVADAVAAGRDELRSKVTLVRDSLRDFHDVAAFLQKKYERLDIDSDRLKRVREFCDEVLADRSDYTASTLTTSLKEIRSSSKEIRGIQNSFSESVPPVIGKEINAATLTALLSCRPIGISSLSEKELIALKKSKIADFLAVRLLQNLEK